MPGVGKHSVSMALLCERAVQSVNVTRFSCSVVVFTLCTVRTVVLPERRQLTLCTVRTVVLPERRQLTLCTVRTVVLPHCWNFAICLEGLNGNSADYTF